MNHRFLLVGSALLVVGAGVSLQTPPLAAQSRAAAATPAPSPAKNWKVERTPWGHPDLAGVYSNSDEDGIPFEKPDEFTGRRLEDITSGELDKLNNDRRAATLGRIAMNRQTTIRRWAGDDPGAIRERWMAGRASMIR